MSTLPLPAPAPSGSGATSTSTTGQSLQQKLLTAAEEAAQVVGVFSPGVAQLIDAGVAVEPVIYGFIEMIKAIFTHHATPATS